MEDGSAKLLIAILMILVLAGFLFCIALLIVDSDSGESKLKIESEDGKSPVIKSSNYYEDYLYGKNEEKGCIFIDRNESYVPPEDDIPTVGPIPFNPPQDIPNVGPIPYNLVNYYPEPINFNYPFVLD